MSEIKGNRCGLCGRRLRKGGDNYRIECTIVADFDGYLHISSDNAEIQKIIEDIEYSGLSERELEEQVYFHFKQKLCSECRHKTVNFLKGIEEK
jgi:hypothetical protein